MKKRTRLLGFLLVVLLVVAACRDRLVEVTGIDGENSGATRAADFKATDYWQFKGKKISYVVERCTILLANSM